MEYAPHRPVVEPARDSFDPLALFSVVFIIILWIMEKSMVDGDHLLSLWIMGGLWVEKGRGQFSRFSGWLPYKYLRRVLLEKLLTSHLIMDHWQT